MEKTALRRRPVRAALALVMFAPLAQAVNLNPAGTGQVLLFPYYTVNAGQVTQISLTNASDRGKALRVRFAEGRNDRYVLSFNLYIAPHDSWTGSVFDTAIAGDAALATGDDTCTYPAIKTNHFLPTLPDGRHYVAFRNNAYLSDAGPHTLDRTREGTVEILEMGSIVPDSNLSAAIAPDTNGVPFDCDYLATAWGTGVWTGDTSANLTNPTGGLYGSASIVDTAKGTAFDYAAVALDDFRSDPSDTPRGRKRSVVLHTKPAYDTPGLSDALTNPAQNLAEADVVVGGRYLHLTYPSGRGIDAVSAVLSARSLVNDYQVSAAGTATAWILSQPTRRYYADQALVGLQPIAPYKHLYPAIGQEDKACTSVGYAAHDANGLAITPLGMDLPLCWTTQVVFLASDEVEREFLGSALVAPGFAFQPEEGQGVFELDFSREAAGDPNLMRGDAQGNTPVGLPILGVAVTDYATSTVIDADSRKAQPHRAITACSRHNGECR